MIVDYIAVVVIVAVVVDVVVNANKNVTDIYLFRCSIASKSVSTLTLTYGDHFRVTVKVTLKRNRHGRSVCRGSWHQAKAQRLGFGLSCPTVT
jgi:hypothetical protein